MRTTASIGVFPAWEDNPYLNYLYLAARARGWETRPTTTYEGAVALLGRLGAGDVFHIHWTAPIVQRAEEEADASARVERFTMAVDDAKSRGVTLFWTVHNVLPHDGRHLDVEVALCRMLADRADVIHVLSGATAALTAPYYELPAAKIAEVPHPSYQGVYPTSVSRAEARARFGIAPEQRVVLFFGQMRPYKGLDSLFLALDALSQDERERTVLLLAGRTRDDDLAELERILPTGVRVVRDHSFIPDADVELWFRAADVAVYPYRSILNSGSLHLAATFGVHALVPGEPHLRDEFEGEDWIDFFDTGEPAESIRRSLAGVRPGVTPATAAEFSRRMSPWLVSSRFADVLEAAVEARASEPVQDDAAEVR